MMPGTHCELPKHPSLRSRAGADHKDHEEPRNVPILTFNSFCCLPASGRFPPAKSGLLVI